MSSRVRTLIIDDHPLLRKGLRELITAENRCEVVGEANDGCSGLEAMRRYQPELVILDVTLPGMSGLEVVRRLKLDRSTAKIIILTMHCEEEVFNTAINLDVDGYVLKENAFDEILNCLRMVAAGDYYISPTMSACLLNRRRRSVSLDRSEPGLEQLTTAERRILRRIADNRTSSEIAAEFCISPRTVDAHRTNIRGKLGLQGSNRLLQFAIENRDSL